MTDAIETASDIPKNAWLVEPTWDDWADSIVLGYRGRSELQFDAMSAFAFGLEPLPADHLPILMEVYKGRWHNRHLTKGRMLDDILISADLRALLLECDPEGVCIEPIELNLGDGTGPTDRYWMLKVVRELDALVPEKSPVVKRYSRRTGKFIGWGYTKNFQPATIKRDLVSGLHIWRLKYPRRTEVFVSDWLKNEMERRGLRPFKARPAPLD